jgi:predicted nuclease of predicted toxin-antitoxin system
VKLLVDMNLSPSWVERLASHGFEAVHWSTISAATAPDVEILTWANEHAFVLITNDLDFSAILAASGGASPSVIQIRTQDLLSDGEVVSGARLRQALLVATQRTWRHDRRSFTKHDERKLSGERK